MRKLAYVFVVVVLAGAGTVIYLGKTPTEDGEFHVATIGKIERKVNGAGRIEGMGEIPLSFGMGGRLDAVSVKEGAEVALNQELAVLNGSEMEMQIKLAESALKEAVAAVEQAKAPLPPEVITQAEEKVKQADADVKIAEQQLKKLETPVAPAAIPDWKKQEAEVAVGKARTELTKAEFKLKKLQEKKSGDDDAVVAKAELDAAKRELELAEERVRNYKEPAASLFATKAIDEKAKLQQEVESKRQAVNVAMAKVDRAYRPAKAEDVEAAKLEVDQLTNELKAALAAKLRLDNPEAPAAPNPADINLARLAVAKAQSELRSAQAKLEEAKRPPDQAKIKAAEAAAERAAIELQKKKLFKEGLTLRAPVDGLVVKRHAEPGIMVAPGQPIITITDFNEKRVRAEFDIARMAEIKPGMQVVIKSRAIKEPLEGKVLEQGRIGPQRMFREDPQAPKGGDIVEFIIAVSEPKGAVKGEAFKVLRPGLPVDAEVILERRDKVLVIPKSFVKTDNGQEKVLRVEQAASSQTQTTTKERLVKTGMRDEYYVEIKDGLSEGDKIKKPQAENSK